MLILRMLKEQTKDAFHMHIMRYISMLPYHGFFISLLPLSFAHLRILCELSSPWLNFAWSCGSKSHSYSGPLDSCTQAISWGSDMQSMHLHLLHSLLCPSLAVPVSCHSSLWRKVVLGRRWGRWDGVSATYEYEMASLFSGTFCHDAVSVCNVIFECFYCIFFHALSFFSDVVSIFFLFPYFCF